MEEVLGELLDQRTNVMPEHTAPQRTTMRAMPCFVSGVLVYLEVPFTKGPSDSASKLQNTTVPRKSKEWSKLT